MEHLSKRRESEELIEVFTSMIGSFISPRTKSNIRKIDNYRPIEEDSINIASDLKQLRDDLKKTKERFASKKEHQTSFH